MYLSKNIRHLRREHKLTQSDVADQIGKSKENVSAYEKERSLPPIDVILKLSEIFQVTIDDLVNKDLSKEGPGRPDDEAPRKSIKPTADDEELFRRLLVLKLEEVSERLKESDPELYEELRLDALVRDQKKKRGLD